MPLPQPASSAAPCAAASVQAGTRNTRPQISAFICSQTALRAPPPSERTSRAGQPSRSRSERKSRIMNAADSITLRARCARVVDSRAP